MDAPGVVPLRAGFDVEFRGYSRKQVLEHIDLLEDQLRMIAIDRDEATKLNTNCSKVCDELRTELDETRARLARIESSSSGLPKTLQGIQNMLSIAEDEADTIRQRAERYAETVRGTANTDARQIRADAEAAATAVRAECEQLVVELESRRDRINVEHGKKIDALHIRAQDLRLMIQTEYEQVMAKAKTEAAELIAEARRQSAAEEREFKQRRAVVEQTLAARREAALADLQQNRAELDEWRKQLIVMLCNSRSAIDASVATVTAHGAALQEQSETWMNEPSTSPPTPAKPGAHSTRDDAAPKRDHPAAGNGKPPAIPRQHDGTKAVGVRDPAAGEPVQREPKTDEQQATAPPPPSRQRSTTPIARD